MALRSGPFFVLGVRIVIDAVSNEEQLHVPHRLKSESRQHALIEKENATQLEREAAVKEKEQLRAARRMTAAEKRLAESKRKR